MYENSKAYSKAIMAMQQCFSTPIAMPAQEGSLQSLLDAMVSQVPMMHDAPSTIQLMKKVSDAQEYRIQNSYVEMEDSPCFVFEECYELASTHLLPQKSLFKELNEEDLIDEMWWSNDKKVVDQSFYFME